MFLLAFTETSVPVFTSLASLRSTQAAASHVVEVKSDLAGFDWVLNALASAFHGVPDRVFRLIGAVLRSQTACAADAVPEFASTACEIACWRGTDTVANFLVPVVA
jgi:hypothetical protein